MNTSSARDLRAALALIVGISLPAIVAAQMAATSSATKDEEGAVKMEKFEVTGSYIKRLDTETPNPVISINVETLDNMGFPTIADAVRALPFNNGQALTPTDSGTSFTPGVNSFNLRGLGNNGTLVLINGRRAVPYAAPGFDGFQTVFDLNSIPDSAIESVDILKDGGSALYGSDAVAGVVNFRLKKNYVGAEATFQVGNYFNTDGLLKKASFSIGTVGRRTSMFTTFGWEKTAPVFSRDLPWSANADKTDRAPSGYGRYEVNDGGVAAAGFSSLAAYIDAVGLTNPVDDGYFDNRSSRGFPGYLTVPGVGRRTFSSPTSNPTTGGATSVRNFYNFNETNGLFPATQRFSLFHTIDYEMTDHLKMFAELSFSRSQAVVYSAATPVDIEVSHGLNSGDQLTYPSYNPFNVWGVNVINGRRRLVELPNRINDVTSDTPRFLLGLRGDLENTGSGFFQEWNWEVAGTYSKNTVNNISRNAVPDYKMQEAFNGLTRLGDGSLVWDPTTPTGDRVYFNWFGLNETAMADFLSVENPNSSTIEYRGMDFRLDGPLMDLPGGQAALAFGGEHRREDFEDIASDLNATGNILGGSEGTSSAGSRDLTAFYAELDLPLHKMVEVQLAGRYEAYSDDGFERKVRPKVAVKFRPRDWVVLRASYAESFKAPDLAYLYNSGTTTLSSNQVIDPVTGSEIDQIQVKSGGNRNLQPETTDTFYAGVSFEPEGKLKGLSVSIDYFNFDQTNLLAQLSDFYGYADFLTQEFQGNPTFNGKVIRDSATNEVLFIRDDYANISKAEYKGFDFEVRYHWNTNTLGNFAVAASATMVDSFTIDDDEQVKGYLTPKWNGTLSANWRYKDWSVNAFGIYRGKRTRSISFGNIFTNDDELFLVYDVDPQITWNASVAYNGFEKTKLLFGINNVLGEHPPLDGFDPLGTTPGVNDAASSFWYAKITREF